MMLSAVGGLPKFPENSVWFRAIQPQHWTTALQTSQTKTFATRFNAGPSASTPFEVLYLAEDHLVAMFEAQALLGSPYGAYVPQPAQAWAIINVTVVMRAVADLSAALAQANIDVTAQELTGDWYGYQQRQRSLSLKAPVGRAPTQSLGAALFGVPGLEGFKMVSARVPDKRTLVVFPTKLRVGSSIQFHDPSSKHHLTISGTKP